uniref:DUF834 domain-containing protein n=1 Tax=Oryza barthii TaxID=65489 RepID=A0A0D3G5Q5_9ORYZ
MELGAGGMVARREAGRRRVRVGAGGRRRGSRPLPCPTVLGEAQEVGERGGRRRRRGQRRWRRGGCRRAGELEGVDGDVVAVVELDGTVDGAAGVGLAEAVEAVEDGLVLADIEALERPNLVLLGAHPPLRPVDAGPASPHRPPHIHSPPRRRRSARVCASHGELGRDGAAVDDDDVVAAHLTEHVAGGGAGPRPTGLLPLTSASLRHPRQWPPLLPPPP